MVQKYDKFHIALYLRETHETKYSIPTNGSNLTAPSPPCCQGIRAITLSKTQFLFLMGTKVV